MRLCFGGVVLRIRARSIGTGFCLGRTNIRSIVLSSERFKEVCYLVTVRFAVERWCLVVV